jgi:DNA-binding GntR family transcriptional regulator
LTQAMSFPNSPSEAEQTPGFGRLAKPETSLLSNRRQVHELKADSLRLTTMAGHHLPGERLNQEEMVSNHGVSRMPVHEALLKLQSEELVIQSPHK